ncbi:hypothetical protein ACFX12_032702 [Malus domestica]
MGNIVEKAGPGPFLLLHPARLLQYDVVQSLVRRAEPANNDVSVNLQHLRQCQHIHDALNFSLQALPVQSRLDRAAKFESSISFASIPLQPVPRKSYQGVSGLAPIEIGFLSGPIERSYLSSPIDRGMYSGPIEKEWH